MVNENNEGTVVGANVKLQGTISDNNDIVVHGSVEGEVISEKNINVTPSASVTGPVRGQIIIVAGTINGDVSGEQKVEVLPTARISGSIATKELIIQSGAIFNGQCQMNEETAGYSEEREEEQPEEAKPAQRKEAEEEPQPDEPDEKYLTEEIDSKKSDQAKPAKKEDSILDDFELE